MAYNSPAQNLGENTGSAPEISQRETDERPTKRFKSDYEDTITVVVGNAKKRFTIHKDIACNTSDFLHEVFSEEWRTRKRTIRLSNVEPYLFKVYVHWLYSGIVDLGIAEQHCECDRRTHDETCMCILCTEVFLELHQAGHALLDKAFQSCVVDGLRDHLCCDKATLNWEIINWVWTRTTDTLLLRRCILDHFILHFPGKFLRQAPGFYNQQFLLDLCNRQLEFRPIYRRELKKLTRDNGVYHDHSEGVECHCPYAEDRSEPEEQDEDCESEAVEQPEDQSGRCEPETAEQPDEQSEQSERNQSNSRRSRPNVLNQGDLSSRMSVPMRLEQDNIMCSTAKQLPS